jgi:hypothetical protein
MKHLLKVKNIKELNESFNFYLRFKKDNTVFCLIGESGIGKTHFFKQFAETKKLKMKYINASNLTPAAVVGIPRGMLLRDKQFTFNQNGIFDLPEYWKDNHLIFIDELNRADIRISNVVMNIVSEKKVDEHDLSKKIMVTAMNETGFIQDFEEDSAFMGRLFLVKYEPSWTEKTQTTLNIIKAKIASKPEEFKIMLEVKDILKFIKLSHYMLHKIGHSFRVSTTILETAIFGGQTMMRFLEGKIRETLDKSLLYNTMSFDKIMQAEQFPHDVQMDLKSAVDFKL